MKSKEEKRADEDAARETALSTAIDSSNKGFKMMAKLGYKPGATLGKSEDARTEPIQLQMKDDRGGIGLDAEKKRRIREEFEHETKRVKADETDYRERHRLQREEARLLGQISGAQKVLEKLETEATSEENEEHVSNHDSHQDQDAPGEQEDLHMRRPIKSINVLWRGLLRARLERERESRMRYELARFNDPDDVYEKSSKVKDPATIGILDDLDDEDVELDDHEALPPEERLKKLVMFLREHFNYCFWCKFRYPDSSLDGCPGVTEEDHD